MKKITSAVLLLAMLLSFAGCNSNPSTEPSDTEAVSESTENTTTEATTEATEPVIADRIPAQSPMAAVSLPVSISNTYTEDDVLLFSYKSQTISLIIPDSEIENKVILDFQTRLDNFSSNAQELADQARGDYNANADWTPYFCNVLYTPGRIDLAVLSLYGNNTSWVGGAHPSHNCTSANYDLITGDVLTLGSILTNQDALDSLCDLLIEQVAEIKAEKYLYSDYEETIRGRFSKNESYNEAWYFSNEGLSFYFSPYEIAPYASGIITVTIPYEKLTGIIEDRYFPAEKDVATGKIQATRHSDTDLDSFTQIAEVILDKEGEMVFLYTDRSVHNVTLAYGSWNEDGTEFTAEYTVFATPMLTPGDAAMIQLSIPDVMPNVRLTYQTGNETVVEYISQSGKDGTILLLSEDAV